MVRHCRESTKNGPNIRQLAENCRLLCPDSARETHAAPGGSDSDNAISPRDEASEAEVGWLNHAAVIVGDINLIAQLLISSQGTSAAEAVFPRDPDWIAPSLWCLKCKIFSCPACEFKAIKTHWLAAYEKADQFVRTAAGAAENVMNVAAETNLSGYDAEFVVHACSRCVL
jgi:hypothetical protein